MLVILTQLCKLLPRIQQPKMMWADADCIRNTDGTHCACPTPRIYWEPPRLYGEPPRPFCEPPVVSLPNFIACIHTPQLPAFHSDADPIFNFIRIGNTG